MNEEQRERFSAALQRVAGDEDMLAMLATIAVEDAPPLMKCLETAVAENELADAAKAAHALKGLLSAFETGEPVSDLQPLIEAARNHNHSEALTLEKEVQPKLETLLGEIGSIPSG